LDLAAGASFEYVRDCAVFITGWADSGVVTARDAVPAVGRADSRAGRFDSTITAVSPAPALDRVGARDGTVLSVDATVGVPAEAVVLAL